MGPELEHILTIGAVLACGSAIQCAAGFGFGLFTIPTLVVLGCEPYEAIVLVSVGATTQGIAGMVALRKHVRWGRILAMVGLAALAQPVGVVVLETLVEHNERLVRRMFGGLVLLALIMMITLRPRPRERLPLWTMVASMLAAGFMGGVSGMSGPPAVLWVISHRWSADESRVTLWALFAGLTPVLILLLRSRFGPGVGEATVLALWLIPASLLGLLPGLWLGARIARHHLRTICLVILAAVSFWALLAP